MAKDKGARLARGAAGAVIAALGLTWLAAVSPTAAEASAAPLAAHTGGRDWYAEDQGAVLWKWHRIARPTVAGIPGNPECWGLHLSSGAGRRNVCVDESAWQGASVGAWYGD